MAGVEVDTVNNTSSKYTRQQWPLLIILSIVTFLGAMIYAIQAPFYPAEAESKNATPSEYGFVLGTFGLTQFILGPIFGTHLLKVGVKNAFHGGILAAAISTMMFGFLDLVENRILFVTLSFILRIVEASGALAMSIATYTFVATDFPRSVARTFAIVETVYGFGLSLGPTVGIALFEIGGFTLPFITLGVVHFLSGGITYLVLPSKDPATEIRPLKLKEAGRKKLGFIDLLKVPGITMFASCIVAAIFTSSFIGALLEPNLRQFNLSSVMLSTMFLLQGMTQAIFSILWGLICDRIPRPEFITFLGAGFLSLGPFLIGPFVFLPFEMNIAMTAVGLVSIGLGSSAILVSSFLQGLREAQNNGFPVDESTSGMISGLFMSAISFGCFSGPLIAGLLFHHFGFRIAASTLTLINLSIMTSLGLFILTKKIANGGGPTKSAVVSMP